jgi:hypothetical protein
MHCQCIRDVSWMYCGCNSLVSLMYYWCIITCTLQWAYTPVFLHTLAITSLGPSPSGHPVFGISSPWVWLLGGGGSHGMAAQGMLFCRQGMHIPACPVGCLAAETTPGHASRWGPYGPGSRPNILGCCGGPNRAQTTVKSPSQVPEKILGDVFTLYFKCIWDVLTMNHTSIDGCISNWDVMQVGCITDVLEMYWAGNRRVLIIFWQLNTSQYIIDVLIYVVRCIMMYIQMYCRGISILE